MKYLFYNSFLIFIDLPRVPKRFNFIQILPNSHNVDLNNLKYAIVWNEFNKMNTTLFQIAISKERIKKAKKKYGYFR